jgi:acyl carrier protein
MRSTHDKVGTLLTKDLGVPGYALVPHASLEELRLDSLALEELRFLAEERFDIDLTDAPMTPRDTVSDLIRLIQQRVSPE